MCVFIWEKYWTATYRAGQLNDGVFYVILSVKVYHRDGTDERWSTDASMSAQLLVLKETKTKLPYINVDVVNYGRQLITWPLFMFICY